MFPRLNTTAESSACKKDEEENLDAVLCYANTGAYDNVFYLSQYWPPV